jgi:hypothetical protein
LAALRGSVGDANNRTATSRRLTPVFIGRLQRRRSGAHTCPCPHTGAMNKARTWCFSVERLAKIVNGSLLARMLGLSARPQAWQGSGGDNRRDAHETMRDLVHLDSETIKRAHAQYNHVVRLSEYDFVVGSQPHVVPKSFEAISRRPSARRRRLKQDSLLPRVGFAQSHDVSARLGQGCALLSQDSVRPCPGFATIDAT